MSMSSKRKTILLDSEIRDLFGAPKFTIDEKRVYFSLSDPEKEVLNSIHKRHNRVFFVLLLGVLGTSPPEFSLSSLAQW